MAENKKSFILYADLIHTLNALDDNEAGLLFKHILRYVNDQSPETSNRIVNLAFEPIKQQLKRDLKRWDAFRVKQSENGKLGGRPYKPKPIEEKPNNPSLISESQKSLNVTVNVTDTVNDNVTVIKKDIDSRKLSFASTLKPFTETYGRDLIKEFYEYWTEPNKSNSKFRQEMEKTWDLKRRLETWTKNDKNFNKKNNDKPSKVEGYRKSFNNILAKRGITEEDIRQFNANNGEGNSDSLD